MESVQPAPETCEPPTPGVVPLKEFRAALGTSGIAYLARQIGKHPADITDADVAGLRSRMMAVAESIIADIRRERARESRRIVAMDERKTA